MGAFTIKDGREMSAIDYARRPDREPHHRLIRSRMGGPGSMLSFIFRGWFSDLCGIPRQRREFYDMFDCNKMECGKKVAPILIMCSTAEKPKSNAKTKGLRKAT